METLIALLVALGLSTFLTQRFCDPESRLHILDHPNERSLHTRPTPRTGGLAVVVGVLFGITLWMAMVHMPHPLVLLCVCALLVAGLSFLDDMKGMSVGSRFAGHLVASGVLLAGGLALKRLEFPGWVWDWPAWLGVMFSTLYLVWMINLYNFMDGMDGFAGGMGVFGFGTFALLGGLAGHHAFLATSLIVAAGTSGFLLFNFPPARIFMGDTGSSALGFLAGGFSLWGVSEGVFPFWIALLVFSPFVVDASVTLIRRLLYRERVWQAHKTHYYQRLVQLGWGHRKTVLCEYALMLACSVSAIWATSLGELGQLRLALFWCGLYLTLMVAITRLENNKAPS